MIIFLLIAFFPTSSDIAHTNIAIVMMSENNKLEKNALSPVIHNTIIVMIEIILIKSKNHPAFFNIQGIYRNMI